MKTLLALASSLALAALLSAQAQTPAAMPSAAPASQAPPRPTPKTPSQRAAAYKGPKVVKDTKALGDKMIRESKPNNLPTPIR